MILSLNLLFKICLLKREIKNNNTMFKKQQIFKLLKSLRNNFILIISNLANSLIAKIRKKRKLDISFQTKRFFRLQLLKDSKRTKRIMKIMRNYRRQLAQEYLENCVKLKMILKIMILLRRVKQSRMNHVRIQKWKMTRCLIFCSKKRKSKMIWTNRHLP